MRTVYTCERRRKDGVYTFRANEKGIKNGLKLARRDKSVDYVIYVRRGTMRGSGRGIEEYGTMDV